MRLLARGEASLYGAIVMSIILVIFASLYSVAVTNLARQGEAYREALRSYLEASRESIGFSRDPSGSIAAYSNTDSRIVYLVVANRSSILYSSRVDISLRPGVSVELPLRGLESLVSRGSAYLAVFTSRGNVFIYRGEGVSSEPGGDIVSSDLWASPLLAIARHMGDMIYSSPGTYWLSGDEAQGQIRITFARSLVIGDGATLYTANPTPTYQTVFGQFGGIYAVVMKAAGGVGVTRIIVADTIVINGTLSSKGLGGAGNQKWCYNYYRYQEMYCNQWYLSDSSRLQQGGGVSSAGGGGYGRDYGFGGGWASLYGYSAEGGRAPYKAPGGPGAVIDYGAFLKTLSSSPYNLQSLSLIGAGGGSGGPGYAAPYGGWGWGGMGGRGGGGIVIVCNRLIMNNGVIEASGEDGGTGNEDSGGGGGGGAGAVFIYCNSVEGSGVIRALGGSGGSGSGIGYPGGRGGDGWVVIVAGYISPNIVIQAGYSLKATP